METKWINEYKIEFYSEEEWNKVIWNDTFGESLEKEFKNGVFLGETNLYVGGVEDIQEELANDVCPPMKFKSIDKNFNFKSEMFEIITAKDSFRTLSELPYCVITKDK